MPDGGARDLEGLRAQEIARSGGDPLHPPAWCFLAHPAVRALVALKARDPAGHRPTDPLDATGPGFAATAIGMRLSYTGIRVEHGRDVIRVDAAAHMARIKVSGDYPEAVASIAVGRPLSALIGLPGMEPGTMAGDAPVRSCWTGPGGLHLTVECALEPLAMAPPGRVNDWLIDWRDRHYS